MFQRQVAVISSLTKGCKSAEVVRTAAEVPEGCASQIITPEVAINIMVRGKIDIDAEVSKIQKKVDHIQGSAEKLKTLQASNSKLPAEVQAANVEKVWLLFDLNHTVGPRLTFCPCLHQLRLMEAEIETLSRSMNSFLQLK
jgi:valyl-tRNA synthetase